MNTRKSLILGTHIYPAKGDALVRMDVALESWRRLGIPLYNLAFVGNSQSAQSRDFTTAEVLTRDSCTISGMQGIRKPLVSDLFDAMCVAAQNHCAEYFAFSNADIILTEEFYDVASSLDVDSAVFSRLDFDVNPDEEQSAIFVVGQDTFVVRTAWWCEHRHRFRPYIVGEVAWDNVYTAILARNGKSTIFYDRNLCLHKRHEVLWQHGRGYGKYNTALKKRYDYLDSSMFGRYAAALLRLRVGTDAFVREQRRLFSIMSCGRPGLLAHAKALVHRMRIPNPQVPSVGDNSTAQNYCPTSSAGSSSKTASAPTKPLPNST